MTNLRTSDYLSDKFLKFSRTDTHGSTPLYSLLAERAAGAPLLTDIAAQALPGQHEPLMLFAAAHYLLLKGAEHPLSEYYASLRPHPQAPDDEAFHRFNDFCLEQRDELVRIVSSRRAQTNEVNRSTTLLPGFGSLARRTAGRPVRLLELGASAGLNLNWDRYGYDYGGGRRYGPLRDPGMGLELTLSTELRGSAELPLAEASELNIAGRLGIDLHPIDLAVPDNRTWLRALIWPEHVERIERLEKAIQITREHPPEIRSGDAAVDLGTLIEGLPSDQPVVVFHSFVVYQLEAEQREQLTASLRELSLGRSIYRLSLEWFETETSTLEVDLFEDGSHEHFLLATADPHGRWLEWQVA